MFSQTMYRHIVLMQKSTLNMISITIHNSFNIQMGKTNLIEIKLLATCTDDFFFIVDVVDAVNSWPKHNWKICDWFIYHIFPDCFLLCFSPGFFLCSLPESIKASKNLFPVNSLNNLHRLPAKLTFRQRIMTQKPAAASRASDSFGNFRTWKSTRGKNNDGKETQLFI